MLLSWLYDQGMCVGRYETSSPNVENKNEKARSILFESLLEEQSRIYLQPLDFYDFFFENVKSLLD